MIKPTVSIAKSGPGVRAIEEALSKLKRADVFVGIPADKTMRQGDQMNNATLAFIQSHGSPLRNIPARPFLEPSIKKNKGLIAPELGQAAQAVFQKQPQQATTHLKRAGTLAANGAKRYFTEGNNWSPNAPSTIKRKKSDKPLIDTGQMRRAITFVVDEK